MYSLFMIILAVVIYRSYRKSKKIKETNQKQQVQQAQQAPPMSASPPRRRPQEAPKEEQEDILTRSIRNTASFGTDQTRADSRPTRASGASGSTPRKNQGASDASTMGQPRGAANSRPMDQARGSANSRSMDQARGTANSRSMDHAHGSANSRSMDQAHGSANSRSMNQARGSANSRSMDQAHGTANSDSEESRRARQACEAQGSEPEGTPRHNAPSSPDPLDEVRDLIVKGYEPRLTYERDFIGESVDFLNSCGLL